MKQKQQRGRQISPNQEGHRRQTKGSQKCQKLKQEGHHINQQLRLQFVEEDDDNGSFIDY